MTKDGTIIALPLNAHILIVKPRSGIGDFILLMPALRALRNTYPKACIDLLVSSGLKALIDGKSLKELHLFDHIIVSPKKMPTKFSEQASNHPTLSSEFTEFIGLLRTLHSAHYDAVLLFQHLENASHINMIRLIIAATGAKWKIGLDNGHGTFLNVKVPHDGFGVKHQAEYSMDVVEAVGAQGYNKSLFFPLADEECQQARMLLWRERRSPIQRPVIAMHPGCASYMKARRWDPARFAQLADMLYREFGGELILLGGSEELPLRELIASSMQSAMPTYILSGQESISLVAAIIKQCDLFVGNDSGLMHLSTAVGTPTVGIFGLTNHKAWGPYTPTNSEKSMAVHLKLACMPCAYYDHTSGSLEGCSTRDCLNELSTDTVYKAILSLFSKNYNNKYFLADRCDLCI